MISFGALVRHSDDGNQTIIEVAESRIKPILVVVAASVAVDEEWYLEFYRDVSDALESGAASSARDHYINYGYFEDRLPRPFVVDEQWYLAQYPDVSEAIRSGKVGSAQHHFERDGFKEGRIAYRGWSL